MKLVRTALALWLCLLFVSSGLRGVVFCVASNGHLCLKFTSDAACSQPCKQDHEDHGNAHLADEQCDYECIDIPLPGGKVPECTVQQPRVTKILKDRLAVFSNASLPPGSAQSLASPLSLAGHDRGAATPPLRTVVLRI